jgi:hypothetical protein
MMDLKSLYAKNILVVGVVRNSAKDIGHNVEVLANSLIKFSTVCWLLIESDSSDNTIEVLGEISKKVENFRLSRLSGSTSFLFNLMSLADVLRSTSAEIAPAGTPIVWLTWIYAIPD